MPMVSISMCSKNLYVYDQYRKQFEVAASLIHDVMLV